MPRKSTWNINKIQDFLESTNSGCVLLSKEITKMKEPLEFQCKCGNHFYRNFHNIRNQKSYYCNSCSKQQFSDNCKLSHDDYLKRLSNKGIRNIIPIEKYQTAKTKILHKCTVCNYKWEVTPSNILSGYGCPRCNGGHCVLGYNDIATTNPEMYQLLKDKDDAYTHTEQSNIPLKFICPYCGNEIKMSPATFYQRGLSCRICGDGISTPNKFVEQILINSSIAYHSEYVFSWSNGKRYDFYLPEHNAIIEVMGIQHYKDGCFGDGCRTLKEEQANDILKERLALDNGIKNYFKLDCRKSDLKYMRQSFTHSNLPDFLKIDKNIDYKECFKNSLKSKIIKAIELWNKGYKTSDIASELKVTQKTIIEYLHSGNDIGLCKYNGLNKEVICLTTGEIFPSIKSANLKYNTNKIGNCCRGEKDYITDERNNKLVWKFYKDYLKSTASSEVSA